MASKIAFPNAERTLLDKRHLAAQVLDDIGRLTNDTAPRAGFVILPLVDKLYEALNRSRDEDVGHVVGPEFYRWLALAGSAVRSGDRVLHGKALSELPSLLLTRLAVTDKEGTYWIPVQNGEVAFPQADLKLGDLARAASMVRIRWNDRRLFLGSADFDLGWFREQVDGVTACAPRLTGSRIYFHQRGAPVREMVEDLRRTASIPVGRDEEISLIPLDQFDKVSFAPIVRNLSEGLALLRTHSHDHAAEIEAVIDAISLVSGRRFVGGSDIWYHGVAVLNPDIDWSPTTYADHLVHEGAHLTLHASNELSPLLLNGDVLGAKSPIREDPRPLYGILHSTYVFMRLVQFFRVATPALGTDEALFRLHRHMRGFYDGMLELERYAHFTASGEAFFRDLCQVRTKFQTELAEPDPRYYRRVGTDYVV